MRGVTLDREREVLDKVWIQACLDKCVEPHCQEQVQVAAVMKGLTSDPSQSSTRCRPKYNKLGCQLKSSTQYSFDLDRILFSCDILGVMGFDPNMLDFADEDTSRGMAGEAIAVQELATILHAVLSQLNAPSLFERPSCP